MVGIWGAGYDFGEGDLRILLMLIGRVEKLFSWLGTDKKDCVLDTLLYRYSIDEDEELEWWAVLFLNSEKPKDLGLLMSSFLVGGGGLLSAAKVVTLVCCNDL